MKTGILMRVLSASLLVVMMSFNARSQVAVERSKDKVVISGVTYYIHQVKKGETAYSISKAYGITVEELTRENPPAVYGINEGQSLRIPYRPLTEATPLQQAPTGVAHDESKYIYHTLKPGETVYFLSKTYDVSENEIIKSNPGIDITKLSVGMEIAIPRKEFLNSRQKFGEQPNQQAVIRSNDLTPALQETVQQNPKPQDKGYILHKVLNGESLSSIAEQYGLSVRELRRANRDLRFPQVGDYIRIPGVFAPEKPEIAPVSADTVVTATAVPYVRPERPSEYTPVRDLGGTLNVAVMLPFYLAENAVRIRIDSSVPAKGRKGMRITRVNDDWIYPNTDFIEMYNGILLAADTLRSLGLSITLHTFDITSDTTELEKIISSGKLDGMDLIIGPVYSDNLSRVAAYAKNMDIPVVSPVPLYDNSLLANNPDLFLASASLEVAQETLARKFREYPDYNFIFIHSDTLGADEDVQRFRRLILSELGSVIPYDEIKFREFPFYSRSMFNNDSINRLSHALSDRYKNLVIIASEEPPVISEAMIDVHNLSKKFDLHVFGYPVMRDLDNLDPKYFFDLGLTIYSPYWIDYTKPGVMRFNASFRQKFLTEPTEKSYAWQGYDLAYYFISGLAMHGKEFIRHPEIHRPELLQTDYNFQNKAEGFGFENRNMYLIEYTKDYEVKLAGQ